MAHANEPLAAIEGEMPKDLKTLLTEVLGKVESSPRSLAQARRRVIKAKESATSVLRSQGYYGADIDARVIEPPVSADLSKRRAHRPVLVISPGPQFKVSSIDIIFEGDAPDISQDALDRLTLKPGDIALAAVVVADELQTVNYLNAHGFPDASAEKRAVIVDHETKTMSVAYKINAGQKTRFGEIKQTGTAYIVKSWPRMVAPFKPGDEFDIREINALASRVIGTGVFDGATAILSEDATPNDDGTVTRDVILNVEQGAINTINGEIGFSTTDGTGVDVSYERRNFIGYAQTLTLSSSLKTNQIRFGVDYNIPFAWRADRELDLNAEVAREDTEALSGERIGANGLMTQKISKKFRVSAGFGLEASRFRESGEDVTSYLIDGIGRAVYDSRNSLFDPELGYLLEAELMPTYNFGDEAGYFTTATLDGSTYRRISDKFVVAGRMKIGSIIGSDFDSIALNRRFFAGGGGSVRGFEYQTISPVDGDGELIGGRSISEVGAELRYKGDSPIGFAAFVDAGSVTEKEFPDFSDIRAGAGIGVRYYTSFAPLRVDIATPINKRPGDSAIQLYISIGQSF
jgi:translocation and assembly module TamA